MANRVRTRTMPSLLMLAAAGLLACGDNETPAGNSIDTANADGGRSVNDLDGSVPNMDASQPSTHRDAAPQRRPDAGQVMAEVCDGIDNDNDGIIDNLDVGQDGICDCLLLATLGLPGTWGKGDVFGAWLSARSNVGAVSLDGKTLTRELLAPYQVIVAQDIHKNVYTDDEVTVLQDWIRAGGGLFTLSGYDQPSERANINRFLSATGIQYGGTNWAFAPLGAGMTSPITGWHSHPISEGVTRLGAAYGYEVVGSGDIVAEQDGLTALRALQFGAGRVVVWTDEWITYDSEWTSHPDYQVERFWLNSIKWLTPAQECQVPILLI